MFGFDHNSCLRRSPICADRLLCSGVSLLEGAMAMPVTRYAKSGDVHVAYQVFGEGPINLVFVPGFVSHIENYWEHPDLARWLLRLGGLARVAPFHQRGTGP